MSGYLSGVLALLLVNILIAYSVFVPAAAGIVNLGAAGFVLIGAYCSGALTQLFGWPLVPAVICGGVLSGIMAFALALPVLRTRGVYMVMATFAFAEIVGGVCINLPGLGGAAGLFASQYAGIPLLLCADAIVILMVVLLSSTHLGLAMRAVHDDENAAATLGVRVRSTQISAFALGGFIGGIGGALLVHQFNHIDVQSTGALFSTYVLLYVLLGGTQTAWGPLAGALFFTFVPEFFRVLGSLHPSLGFLESGRFIIFGSLIIGLMRVRPEGLLTRKLVEAVVRRAFPVMRGG